MLGRLTLVSDHCWVCNERFKSSTPPGRANREDHHIFPRNAGGDDGPLVSLCDSDHATAHKIASRLHKKRPIADLATGEPPAQLKKLVWLASCIVKAEKSVEGDSNKFLNNGVSMSKTDTAMMVKLQSVYPKKSRSDLFRAGLALLYRSHFG